MRPTIEREHRDFADAPFEHREPSHLERHAIGGIQSCEAAATEPMDKLLAAVKLLFLFLPGTVALHFLMVAFALLSFYDDWNTEILLGSLGIFLVSSFMIMLGLGKLTDLRYLRVVGAMVAAGALASITYSLSIVFIRGDFFARFLWCSLPFTLLIGMLIKRNLDTRSEA